MSKVMMVTKLGTIIKMDSDCLMERPRGGKGVRGIRLSDGDEVVSMVVVEDKDRISKGDQQ